MEYKSTNGNGLKYIIRKSLENKKHWIIEVYFESRQYPNIISGRYLTLKKARQKVGEYNTTKEFCFWGDI